MIIAFHLILQALVIARILLRPHRDPASRISWMVVVLVLPVLGLLGYLLLGETNIGRRRVARMQKVLARLPEAASMGATAPLPLDRLVLWSEAIVRTG